MIAGQRYLLGQRNYIAYNTLAEATLGILLKAEGEIVFEISTGKFFHWNVALSDWIELSPTDTFYSTYCFRETFTGNALNKTFQLTGNIQNGTLGTSWNANNIRVKDIIGITEVDYAPVYDSVKKLNRNQVKSILVSPSGLVTTDFAPRLGVTFYIWYWYSVINPTDVTSYTKEDYVGSMEANRGHSHTLAEIIDLSTFAGGVPGPPGPAGTSIVWLGSFATPPASPNIDEAYYNTADGISYIWNGSWYIMTQDGADGAPGSPGAPGTDGNTILNGTVDPTTEGVNGDFYINTVTNFIYGPKAGGVWPAGVSIIGTPGAAGLDGKTVLNGTVDPTTEGVDGDFYINTITYDIFGPKTGGVWGVGTSLIGPAGPLVDHNDMPNKDGGDPGTDKYYHSDQPINVADDVEFNKVSITSESAITRVNLNDEFKIENTIAKVAGLGKALDFNGSSDKVILSSLPAFASTDPHTYTAWVKIESYTTYNWIVVNRDGGSNGLSFTLSFGCVAVYDHNSNTAPRGNTALTAGAWSFIAAVFDGAGGLTFYLNGNNDGTGTVPGTWTAVNVNPEIASNNGSWFFDGIIDELVVYDYALTNVQIAALYNGGVGVPGTPEAGLVSGWHFDEGVGLSTSDFSGGGATGTLTGPPVWVDGWLQAVGSDELVPIITSKNDTAASIKGQIELGGPDSNIRLNQADRNFFFQMLQSEEADGATAVAFELDTVEELSAAGSMLLKLYNNGVVKLYIDKDGNIGVGISPEARLHLAAGTSLIAPFKLTSGTLTNENNLSGNFEFNVDDLYFSITTPLPASYVSQYPPNYNDTYVKASSSYGPSGAPPLATNPALSLTGAAWDNTWATSYVGVDVRFHIDLGSVKIINRLYYENFHDSGSYTWSGGAWGAKNFTLWGSNDAAAFAELTYGIDTNWTELTMSSNVFDQHALVDAPDPKYITASNTVAYRYYAIKIADSWQNWIALRRIELQYGSTNSRKGIILNNGVNLTSGEVPVATDNGRLEDSGKTIADLQDHVQLSNIDGGDPVLEKYYHSDQPINIINDVVFNKVSVSENGINVGAAKLMAKLNADYTQTEITPDPINTTRYDSFGIIGQFPSGKMFVAYRSGTNHTGIGSDGYMAIRFSLDAGMTWSNYITLLIEAGVDVRNASGGVTPSGRAIVFYSRYLPATLTRLSQNYIYSDDDGVTWSDPLELDHGVETNYSTYGPIIAIGEGKLMTSWYGLHGAPSDWSVYVVTSVDDGLTWTDPVVIVHGTVTYYNEIALVYLGGSAIVGLCRYDPGTCYRQFISLDNGATWVDQGDTTFDTWTSPRAPWLCTFKSLSGRRMVAAYYSNQQAQKMRVIIAEAADLITNGVTAWQQDTLEDLGNAPPTSGYPSVIHPYDSPFGIGWYYYQQSAADADITFFIYPTSNTINGKTTFKQSVYADAFYNAFTDSTIAYNLDGTIDTVTVTGVYGNKVSTMAYALGNLTSVVTVYNGRTETVTITRDGFGNITSITKTIS